jgi:hypothetical protein
MTTLLDINARDFSVERENCELNELLMKWHINYG